jgi:hypothetical protein
MGVPWAAARGRKRHRCMQVGADRMPQHHVESLQQMVRMCYTTSVQGHQLMDNADVYGMIQASVSKAQEQSVSAAASEWLHLVRTCAPFHTLPLFCVPFSFCLPPLACLSTCFCCTPSKCRSHNLRSMGPDKLPQVNDMRWPAAGMGTEEASSLIFCCVRRLHLDESAQRTAKALRLHYLKKVESIYAKRHELNLEAVKVLLPVDVGVLCSASKQQTLRACCCWLWHRSC